MFLECFRRLALGFATSLVVALTGSFSHASVICSFAQSGSDVVATLSGSYNFDILEPDQFATFFSTLTRYSSPSTSIGISTAGGGLARAYSLTGTVHPVSGDVLATPSSVSITGIAYFDFAVNTTSNLGRVFLPNTYVKGTSISGTITFANKTLADLKLDSFGDFTYTITGGNSTTDSLTFRVLDPNSNSGAVPEPTSMAIFGLGALGMAYRARRKAKAQA